MGCGSAMSIADGKVTQLVEAARAARRNGYAPYSRFSVGAAVRLKDGQIVPGANFENASLGLSLCAETVALAATNAMGRLADVEAIAVAGGPIDADGGSIVTPCGRCRQILVEVEQVAGRLLSIYCADTEGDAIVEHSIASLLPFAFGPNDLGVTPDRKS